MEFGNIYYYFFTLFIFINLTILCVKLLINKSDRFVNIFIFSLLLFAFLLHFVKLFFEPYVSDYPKSFSSVTFENICAVNTIIFPWIYLSKNKILKDYMVTIGLISGLGSIILPYRSVGFDALTFDIARFYIDHYILFLAPFLMLITHQYRFNLKSVFKVPFVFYGILVLILTNEVILMAIGIINGDINYLLDPNHRNGALLFGPNKYMLEFDWLYNPFVPKIFKTVPFGPNAGKTMYWPIIWAIIPAYIYIVLGGAFMNLVFNVILEKKLSFENQSSIIGNPIE